MLCEHLEELQNFVRDNELEIGGLDMIRVVCKKCNVQHECPQIAVEFWEEGRQKNTEEKRP
ncbi:hypothetical protein MJD09_15405 [bacterium]|nr:hypothetical protein [bacterium]